MVLLVWSFNICVGIYAATLVDSPVPQPSPMVPCVEGMVLGPDQKCWILVLPSKPKGVEI